MNNIQYNIMMSFLFVIDRLQQSADTGEGRS